MISREDVEDRADYWETHGSPQTATILRALLAERDGAFRRGRAALMEAHYGHIVPPSRYQARPRAAVQSASRVKCLGPNWRRVEQSGSSLGS